MQFLTPHTLEFCKPSAATFLLLCFSPCLFSWYSFCGQPGSLPLPSGLRGFPSPSSPPAAGSTMFFPQLILQGLRWGRGLQGGAASAPLRVCGS